jgi:hypothetical protein
VAPNQPFIVGYWHKNAQEKIILFFLLAPPNHFLGPFFLRGSLSSYWKVPRGLSHDHGSSHSHSTLLTSAFPLLCFFHKSGRRTFKAPRKAEWPPRVECLTTTTWQSIGLLPSFTQGVAVAAIDVRSHTNWVRRALQLGELMTAFKIPAATQGTFAPEFITQVCASLPTLTPLGVLRLLLIIFVPLKGRSFTGGGIRWRSCLPGRRWPC